MMIRRRRRKKERRRRRRREEEREIKVSHWTVARRMFADRRHNRWERRSTASVCSSLIGWTERLSVSCVFICLSLIIRCTSPWRRRDSNGSLEWRVLGRRKPRLWALVEQCQIWCNSDRRIPTLSQRKVCHRAALNHAKIARRARSRVCFRSEIINQRMLEEKITSFTFFFTRTRSARWDEEAINIPTRLMKELKIWRKTTWRPSQLLALTRRSCLSLFTSDFLYPSAQCESIYCRSLSRLQSQLTKVQQLGTFTPIWGLIREFFDRTTAAHLTVANAYQDLLRDIHNYQEVLPKKAKAHIQKDADISKTADLIAQLNHASAFVTKAKEQYHLLTLDYERAKRTGSASNNNLSNFSDTTISSKQIDRLEKKHRQAQEEYKLAIEKYNAVRVDYEKRFSEGDLATTLRFRLHAPLPFLVCAKFQNFEIDHIEKMLAFSLTYSSILEESNEQIQTGQTEFNQKLKAFTGHALLEAFVEDKKTGMERPSTSDNDLWVFTDCCCLSFHSGLTIWGGGYLNGQFKCLRSAIGSRWVQSGRFNRHKRTLVSDIGCHQAQW